MRETMRQKSIIVWVVGEKYIILLKHNILQMSDLLF